MRLFAAQSGGSSGRSSGSAGGWVARWTHICTSFHRRTNSVTPQETFPPQRRRRLRARRRWAAGEDLQRCASDSSDGTATEPAAGAPPAGARAVHAMMRPAHPMGR